MWPCQQTQLSPRRNQFNQSDLVTAFAPASGELLLIRCDLGPGAHPHPAEDMRQRTKGKMREWGSEGVGRGRCECVFVRVRSLRSCCVPWNTHGLNSTKRLLQNPQIWQTEPLTHSPRANYVRKRRHSRSNPDSDKQEISVHCFFGLPEVCHILKWYPLERACPQQTGLRGQLDPWPNQLNGLEGLRTRNEEETLNIKAQL